LPLTLSASLATPIAAAVLATALSYFMVIQVFVKYFITS